jgi:hypothetical protein
LVPIGGSESLRYGSSDGGKTILRNSDFEIDGKAKEIAEKLCLKQHRVGATESLWLAGDVEIHRGTDQRIWLIDLQRLLPPFSPHSKHSILTHFFPLKFLQEYCETHKMAISADVFSGFNKSKSRRIDNEEAKKMEIFYFDFHLRNVCRFWEANPEVSFFEMGKNFNKRHLGLLLDHLKTESLRNLVQFEMVFRTIKIQTRKMTEPILRVFFTEVFDKSELQNLELFMKAKFDKVLAKADLLKHLTAVRSNLHKMGLSFEKGTIEYFPTVKKIRSLSSLTEDGAANPSLRSETLLVSNLNERINQFRSGFLKLFEGHNFNQDIIKSMLEEAVKKNYL